MTFYLSKADNKHYLQTFSEFDLTKLHNTHLTFNTTYMNTKALLSIVTNILMIM